MLLASLFGQQKTVIGCTISTVATVKNGFENLSKTATKLRHFRVHGAYKHTDRELARSVEFLKEQNKILRSRVPAQIHTKPHERERLLKLGKPLGRAIEELLTIVSASTF